MYHQGRARTLLTRIADAMTESPLAFMSGMPKANVLWEPQNITAMRSLSDSCFLRGTGNAHRDTKGTGV